MKTLVLILVACSSMLGAIAIAAPAEKSTSGLYVEVLIYSGRANPRFLIDDPKITKELVGTVKGLPKNDKFTKATVLPSILGYNGLSIENMSTDENDLSTILIHRSNIELRVKQTGESGNAVKDFRLDAGSKLEKRILQIAIERGVLTPTEVEATAEAK